MTVSATVTPPLTATFTPSQTATLLPTQSFTPSPTMTPEAPVLTGQVDAGGSNYVFTGTGQPGSTVVIVEQPGNIAVGSGPVASDGTFVISATVAGGLTTGDSIQADAGSVGGLSNGPQSVAAAPSQPVAGLVVPDVGATILTVSGAPGSPGLHRRQQRRAGQALGQGVIGSNGEAAITLDQPVSSGENLALVQGGQVSATVVGSATAGQAATLDPGFVFVEGGTLTGHGVPGDTVQLVDGSGNVLGSAVVGATGAFSLPVSGAQAGSNLKLVQNGVVTPLSLVPQKLANQRVFTDKNVFKPLQGGSFEHRLQGRWG